MFGKPQGEPTRPSSNRGDSSRSTVANAANRPVPSIEVPPRGQPTSATQSPAQQPLFRVPQSPRSGVSESQTKAAKVAIPRLKRTVDANSETSGRHGGRHRVNHACEPCRHRKTKCSGEKPVCRHCQDFKIVCFYADGKRDRVKKQFGTMTEKVADYEKLLKDLIGRVGDEDASMIRASLDKAAQIEADDTYTDTATLPSLDLEADEEQSGAESEASAGAGSTGALDRTDEDFTREGARATGFLGKNSEVTWMQRLRQENRFGGSPPREADNQTQRMYEISARSLHSKREPGDYVVPLPEAADGFAIHESSYHLDDLAITTFEAVDPYEMPTAETAHNLFATYMRRVHPTFPVVGQVNLSLQFQRYLTNPTQRPPDKWLAIVNLIFAIAAKYSHLVQVEWQGDERDHSIYFTRARLLAVNHDTIFQHPDLQMIQILGLMSFYLLCCSQINRSWCLIGIAVRGATALGLNMRNDSANLRDSLKEIRYRLWWSLYSLEHRLCSITGRVNCILDDHCTTPLPIPVNEEQFDTDEGKKLLSKELQQGQRAPSANSYSPSVPSQTPSEKRSVSSKSEQSRSPSALQTPQSDLEWTKDVSPNSSFYFLHLVQLTRLTQNIFHQLYNPASIEASWSYVQMQIKDLNSQLESWYRKLPSIFDFRRKQRDRDFYEFRLSLGFFYYGTKQMIYRPCLCRLDRKIPNQSTKSHEFNRNAAMACVEAAQDSLRLLPDEPNAVGLIRVGPWWTILHWLVQATSVLMLEISFRAHHMPEEADTILASSKKAVRWLHALGEDNLSAKRAWALCNGMLHESATKIGREVTDVPENPPGRDDISSEGGTSMSGVSGAHNVLQQTFQPSGMATQPFVSGVNMPSYQMFANYDPMMQYDQYFPSNSGMNVSMAGDPSNLYGTVATDAEMEFMTNAYHENPSGHGPGAGREEGSGMGGGSGFAS